MQYIDSFIKFIAGISYINILVALVVIILFFVLSGLLPRQFLKISKKLCQKTGHDAVCVITAAFEKPMRIFIILLGFLIALRMIPQVYFDFFGEALIMKMFRSGIIILITWGLFNLEDTTKIVAAFLVKRLDQQSNGVLLTFVSKILRFITIAIALLIVAQEWNFSISGLLAGLGLGGLAFALAAKDMLANIFGGVVIFIDKPLTIGDWIKVEDIEGTVEDINFRSVKVRTFTQAIVTIPNSVISNQPITNYSRMGKRRINFNVGLSFHTEIDKIKVCVKKIREKIELNENVFSDSAVVAFDSIGDSCFNMMVYCYTKTTVWQEYMDVKEEIYYDILEVLKEDKVELAFPSQTLYLENRPKQKGPDLDNEFKGMD